MFADIAHATIDHYAAGFQIFGARRHQTAPAGRVQALWLLDVHDLAGLVAVGKVPRGLGRRLVAGLDHLDRHGRALDPRGARAHLRRPHVKAIKEAPVRVLELHQRIANLGGFGFGMSILSDEWYR